MCKSSLVKFSLNKIRAPLKSIGVFLLTLVDARWGSCCCCHHETERKCSFIEPIYITEINLPPHNYKDLQRTPLIAVHFKSRTHFPWLQRMNSYGISQAQPRLAHLTAFTRGLLMALFENSLNIMSERNHRSKIRQLTIYSYLLFTFALQKNSALGSWQIKINYPSAAFSLTKPL